jgi:L-arabinose transport system permease protein
VTENTTISSSNSSAPVLPYAAPRASRFWIVLDEAGMLIVLAALFIGCCLLVPNFFSPINLKSILFSAATVGMVSCTMLFCLASGNFDLSVGTLLPCAGVIAAMVVHRYDNFFLGLCAGLGVGLAVGLLNGVIIAVLRINPLITTLATMQIVKTIAFVPSRGVSVGISNERFLLLGTTSILHIQTPIWLWLACALVFGFVLARTTFGGNEEAARLAGVPVIRTKILIFVIQGLVTAFAGIVLASKVGGGYPKSMEGFELEVIAACVLGGVSLTGGIGKMSFVIAGVLIMSIVQNAMNLWNIDPLWQWGIRGSILLAAVIFDQIKRR